MHFANPTFLWAFILTPLLIWAWRRWQPGTGHSNPAMQSNLRMRLFGWMLKLMPYVLLTATWGAVCVTFAFPQFKEVVEKETKVVRNIVTVTDISGSMFSGGANDQDAIDLVMSELGAKPGMPAEPWQLPPGTTNVRPIDIAKAAQLRFIPLRKGDRIGAFAFDDDSYPIWPLSLDHRPVVEQIRRKLGLRSGGGTNFDGPYGFYQGVGCFQCGINHFEEMKQKDDESRILVLITDGEASINQARYKEIVRDINRLKIKVYLLGVGSSWTRQEPSHFQKDIINLLKEVKGEIIPVGNAKAMADAFAKIDREAPSIVVIEKEGRDRPLYQYFAGASLVLLILTLAAAGLARKRI